MTIKRALLLVLVVMVGFWAYRMVIGPVPAFPDLVGPLADTPIPPPPAATDVTAYASDSTVGVGLYVHDVDSSWLGLAHGLTSIGVPFRVVTALDQALEHRVVMVYPAISGANTSLDVIDSLQAHVDSGGTVVGFSVVGTAGQQLFGYGESREHRRRQRLVLQPTEWLADTLHKGGAAEIILGNSAVEDDGLPGVHYLDPQGAPLALYDDGSVAITRTVHASESGAPGHAYAIGTDLGHFILRAQNGRFPMLSSHYVNTYQPQVDTLLRLLKGMYRDGDPAAITLSPTPHGKAFTALLTFDVDFTHSMNNVPRYAALAARHGVPATFFIQTKYVTDYNDRAFFDPSRIPAIQQLIAQGMEVASHTVSHSNELKNMPVGTGTEQYPDYRPFVFDFDTVRDASILGELRVAKFLLEYASGAEVHAFRPGHLSLPEALPQLLAATGYRYSSSITANEALTHLPYRLMHNRSYGSEVSVYEFPVTIEDEEGVLGERFDQAVVLSEQIAQNQGLVNLLIHTDELGHKYEFVDRYLTRFADQAWFGTVSGYGDWWRAREDVTLIHHALSPKSHRLSLSLDGAIDGLTLKLPAGWVYQHGVEESRQRGQTLVVGPIQQHADLYFNTED